MLTKKIYSENKPKIYDLNYSPKDFDVTKFHTSNTMYQQRFIPIVTDTSLNPLLNGVVYPEKDYLTHLERTPLSKAGKTKLSLVVMISPKLIEKSMKNETSNFYGLIQNIKGSLAFKSNKILFNPFNRLHFSFPVDEMSFDKAEKIKESAYNFQLPKNEILIQGLTFSEYINGRVFITVNPSGENIQKVKSHLSQYGGRNFPGAFIGFLNLTEDLSAIEKTDLAERINFFQNKPLFEIPFDNISVVNHSDDLLINSTVFDQIPLGFPFNKKKHSTNTTDI